MECDSDTIALVAYQKPREEPRDSRRRNYRTLIGSSDTEMARENDGEVEINGYHSETVSLPSVRAHLASSMRYRETPRDAQKESTPLLMDSRLQEPETGDGQNYGTYEEGYASRGPPKMDRAAKAKLWYVGTRSNHSPLFVYMYLHCSQVLSGQDYCPSILCRPLCGEFTRFGDQLSFSTQFSCSGR